MQLVAGVDSSTQSCKVVVCDAETGRVVREGRAPHPPGTEVDPTAWLTALEQAVAQAGGWDDVAAVSVAGQQHGMVLLDDAGAVVRPALLWNDTRSADAARDLVAEYGDGDPDTGRRRWARDTGVVPVASFTGTKLRWVADHEPDSLARTAAVALPHDWLTWQLMGGQDRDLLVTDRSDASGTAYYDPAASRYRRELLDLACRGPRPDLALPRVLGPADTAGRGGTALAGRHLTVAAGCGDNAAAALGLGLTTGMTSVSLGTSGVVAAVSEEPTADARGLVAGFADATGRYLPLACTLNASRVFDAAARMLGVDLATLSSLALQAPRGADGLVLVPYLEGERTPDLPEATGTLTGLTAVTATPEHLARAAVEGVLCLMAECLDAVREAGVPVTRIVLVGGGARSEAVRSLAAEVWGVDVTVPTPGEYVARGAARQAAWALSGAEQPPDWSGSLRSVQLTAPPQPQVLAQFRSRRQWPD